MQRNTQMQAPGSRCRAVSRSSTVRPQALFGRKPAVPVKEPVAKTTKGAKVATPSRTTKQQPAPAAPKRKESFMSQTISAFDFAEVRSAKDADLLYEAKYGKRAADGKMTPEQYAALRRKIGGTSKDFFKSWVEEEQPKNIKTYYKDEDINKSVPFLPLLVAVLVGMIVATVVVVAKTS